MNISIQKTTDNFREIKTAKLMFAVYINYSRKAANYIKNLHGEKWISEQHLRKPRINVQWRWLITSIISYSVAISRTLLLHSEC